MKTAIEGLGANKLKKAIVRAGRAVGSLTGFMNSFDKEIGVCKPSGKHSEKSRDRDLVKIVDKLLLKMDKFLIRTRPTSTSRSPV